jgi:UDP-N-acetylmuramate--alanine ligase
MTGAVETIPQRVHLVGVGGIHMSAIAQVLLARGHAVSGSDLYLSPLTERLEEMGVTVSRGHDATHVDEADMVVYTSAAPAENPELVEAHRRGLPTIKRAAMVARLMEGKRAIAVAGSHGKTTTSSLIAFMLWQAGRSPTFMVGGEMLNLETNALPGDGPDFVVEADEFDAAFLNYYPDIALVTNVEPDHLDIYGSYEGLLDAFRRFLSQVKPDGYIVACEDDPALRAMLPQAVGDDVHPPVHVVSYGLHSDSQWRVENISSKGVDGFSFVVKCGKQVYATFETRLPGIHNVSNALGAIAVGSVLGLPLEAMRQSVAEFRGVRRRFQPIGEAAGVTVMDDYAHHPTEVQATLAAARQRFPGRRLICLFQPHTYTRTRYLLDGFRTCFAECDVLLIAETYAAREEPSAGMSAEQLAAEISQPPARYAGDLNQSAEAVAALLEPGDVFFTIGAGDVEKVAPMVLEALKTR